MEEYERLASDVSTNNRILSYLFP